MVIALFVEPNLYVEERVGEGTALNPELLVTFHLKEMIRDRK